MLTNYLRIAVRNLLAQRSHLLINCGGLAVGMTCALLIGLYVRYELSYDAFHADSDRIYRVVTSTHARQPVPLGRLMGDELPAVEAVTTIKRSFQPILSEADQRFLAHVHFVDDNLFEFFDYPLLTGNPATVLTAPHSMVISRRIAETYFRGRDPVGATLTWDGVWDFQVTGVAEVPANSHFQFEVLASISTMTIDTDFVSGETYWGVDGGFAHRHNYVRLAEGSEPEDVTAQALDLVEAHAGSERRHLFERDGGLQLQPLRDIHLRSQLSDELGANGQLDRVWLATAIAVFVLAVACVNYINLATALSARRAREVGVRKALGANRGQLMLQFLGESFVVAVLSLVVAVVIAAVALPAFGRFSTADLHRGDLLDPALLLLLLAAGAAIGLLAGLYPALFLSSFRPVQMLRGVQRKARGVDLRKALILSQFALSIVMTVATGVIWLQLQFLQSRPLGFNKDQLVVLMIQRQGLNRRAPLIHEELLVHPRIHNAASFKFLPATRLFQTVRVTTPGATDSLTMAFNNVEAGFIDLMELKLLAGQPFSLDRPAAQAGGLILNRAATRALGYATPEAAVGEPLPTSNDGSDRVSHIRGVVEDFHFEPLHYPIRPMVMNYEPWDWAYSYSGLRIDAEAVPETIAFIEETWARLVPEFPLQMHFLDSDFEQLYRSEQRLSQLLAVFAALAIMIACLGVWALTAHAGERRTKEIGVRKVLGATEGGIVGLLAKEFAILAVVANLIAWPLAWWAMDRWLGTFAYRTDLAWWLFGAGSLLVLVCALAAAAQQALSAARTDPVRALRWE